MGRLIISEEEKIHIRRLYEQSNVNLPHTHSLTETGVFIWNHALTTSKGKKGIIDWINQNIQKNPFLTNKKISVPGGPFYKSTKTKDGKWGQVDLSLVYKNSKVTYLDTKSLSLNANFLLTISYSSNLSGDYQKDAIDTINQSVNSYLDSLNEEITNGLTGVKTVSAVCKIKANYTIKKVDENYILDIQPTSVYLTSSKLEIPNSNSTIRIVDNNIKFDLGTIYNFKSPVLDLGNITNFDEIKNSLKKYQITIPETKIPEINLLDTK